MPLKSIGKEIIKIQVGKNKINLFFIDEKISISPNTYVEFGLYVGKKLNNKALNEITEFDNLQKHLSFAIVSLSKKTQSESAIRSKLVARGANNKQIERIIEYLKTNSLLNDYSLIDEYLEYANTKHFGYYRIKDELLKSGVPINNLETHLVYDDYRERKIIIDAYNMVAHKYASLNFKKRKEKIYQSLLRLGFNKELICEIIDRQLKRNEKEERLALKKDAVLSLHRFNKKYKDNELSSKMIDYLYRQGYDYKLIIEIMEEVKK